MIAVHLRLRPPPLVLLSGPPLVLCHHSLSSLGLPQVRATAQIFIIIIGCELSFTYYIHPGEPTTRMRWGGSESGTMTTPTCQTSRNNWFDSEKQLYDLTIVGRVFVCFIWCFDVVHGFVLPWGGT